MSITFQCPNCKATRSVPDVMSGRQLRCPSCDALVDVIPIPGGSPAGVADLRPANGIAADGTFADEVLLEPVELVPTPGSAPPPQSAGPKSAGRWRKPVGPPQQPPEDEAPAQLKKSKLVETEMDMTPMVDATFQLLIFFMITAAFALQKSKEIPKPKSDEASTNVVQQEEDESTNAVIVRIDEFDSYLVINADGDEEEAHSVLDLHTKLRKAHDGDSEGRIPKLLRVEVHDEATNGRVITAIDAGNGAGFSEVQLASIVEEA